MDKNIKYSVIIQGKDDIVSERFPCLIAGRKGTQPPAGQTEQQAGKKGEKEKEGEKETGKTPERSQDGKDGGAQERPDIEMADTPLERVVESEDVYVTDDEKFPPGNYFNVRAGRKAMREKGEMVTGDMPDLKKRVRIRFGR